MIEVDKSIPNNICPHIYHVYMLNKSTNISTNKHGEQSKTALNAINDKKAKHRF